MNRAPAPVPSIEETSLNRLWAAPKLPRLSFNQLAVSGCTGAVPSDQLGRRRAGRQLRHTRPGLSMMVFDSAYARQAVSGPPLPRHP